MNQRLPYRCALDGLICACKDMRLPESSHKDRSCRANGASSFYAETPMRCRCLIVNQRPTCNFTFDAHSRASGTTQMTRVPTGGTVAFQSCGVWMDNNNVTSTTCFRVRARSAV